MLRTFVLLALLLGTVPLRADAAENSAKPYYVATIAPLAAIVQGISGTRAEVSTLLPSGASPHTYEARPSDLKIAGNALALFHISKAFDGWASRLPDVKKIAVLPFLPSTLVLTITEGAHHGHGHGHDEEEGGVDAHFWTDPVAVKAMLPQLAKTLCELDADGCPVYQKNAKSFEARLDALNAEIAKRLAPLAKKPVMLAYPFFRYFLNRYGISKVNIIVEIPGKEPSPKRLKTVIKKANSLGISAIFSMPQLSDRPAKIVAESSGAKVITLDPLNVQSDYESLIRSLANKFAEGLE